MYKSVTRLSGMEEACFASGLLEFRGDVFNLPSLCLGEEEVEIDPHDAARPHEDDGTIWVQSFLWTRREGRIKGLSADRTCGGGDGLWDTVLSVDRTCGEGVDYGAPLSE